VSDRFAVPLSNADGSPYTGGTAPSVVDFRDLGGGARPVNPAISHAGDGLWKGEVTDADVQTGSILLLQAPANVFPAFWLRAFCLEQNPIAAAFFTDAATGALWAGAAPSVIAGRSLADNTVQALSLSIVKSPYLVAMRPSAAQLAAGIGFSIDGPAGAVPTRVGGSLFPTSNFAASSGTQLPAHDLATFLAGTLNLPSPPGGAVLFTYGAGGNMTMGPVRAKDETIKNVHVSVLQTGGPPPMPFVDSAGVSWNIARVQVTVRSQVDDFLTGQATAVGLLKKAHMAKIPGYTLCLVQESVPNPLGADERGTQRWSFNVEMQFKS
jgi:hypothetical protein